jgi:hypothetical protein
MNPSGLFVPIAGYPIFSPRSSYEIVVVNFAHRESSGRVAPGRCLPRAPTDPDVQISRIRLFETRFCYSGRAVLGSSPLGL